MKMLYSVIVMAQDTSKSEIVLRSIANAVLENATFQFVDQISDQHFMSPAKAPQNAHLRPASPYTDWRYWNGVLNIDMIRLRQAQQEPGYIEFALKNIAFSFDNYPYFENGYHGEDKWSYPFGQCFIMEELDDCGAMGASIIEVCQRDPQDRYRTYVDQAAQHILAKQSRLDDGTFVRLFPFKWTLWADDLYMSVSFLSRIGELTGDRRYFDDAARQVIKFHEYLFNEEKGLMYHCWYSDVNQTGVAFWGRGNGWALLGQVDLLDRIPEDHPQRSTLLKLLERHILGIARYQSNDGHGIGLVLLAGSEILQLSK